MEAYVNNLPFPDVLHSKWKNEHRLKYIFWSKYMKRVSLHTLACTPYVPS
jgi:hypothetical protein